MKRLLGLAMVTLLIPDVLVAQVDRATLAGTISDAAGAVVANLATNVASVQQTTETGSYLVVDLIPWRYRLEVELAGFKKSSRQARHCR